MIAAVRRRVAGRSLPRELFGLIALVVLFIGIGGLFVTGRTQFLGTDETAHLGYAHAIADFTLPTIEGMPPVPQAATLWQLERSTVLDIEHLGVWVANHPPLHYVTAAPAIWISELLNRPDGGLLFMRMINLGFGAVGIVFTYLLALEVSGGARRIALTAASVAGLIGLAPAVFSIGMNDGSGFAAATFLLWAAVRHLRLPTRRNTILLGAAVVVAFGTRTATMLMAVALVAAIAGFRWFDQRDNAGFRTALGLAAKLLAPAVVLFGWFYVRNVILYGDIGASDYLFDRFNRWPRGSVFEMLRRGEVWWRMLRKLTAPSTARTIIMPGTMMIGGVAIAGFIAAVRAGRTADHAPRRIDRRMVLLLLVAIAMTFLTIAQHLSGGGYEHSRYFMPAMGAIATIVAIGADRVWPRVAPALLVGMLAWWSISQIPTQREWGLERRRRARYVVGSLALNEQPGSAGWRQLLAAMIIAGALTGAVVLLIGLVRPGGSTSDETVTPAVPTARRVAMGSPTRAQRRGRQAEWR